MAECCRVLSRHRLSVRFLARVEQCETRTAFLKPRLTFPRSLEEKTINCASEKVEAIFKHLKHTFIFLIAPVCVRALLKSEIVRGSLQTLHSSLPHPSELPTAAWWDMWVSVTILIRLTQELSEHTQGVGSVDRGKIAFQRYGSVDQG